jgi:histone acetyltransferase (RNA polymerase elongator complex component)
VATIELGVQSMDDGVLRVSNRGHRASDTIRALSILRERGYETGVQMMTGLPGSTPETDLGTAETLAELRPDFARIYPTVVIDGSPLARMYRDGVYVPPDLTATVSLVKFLYLTFTKKGVRVIRMGLQATEELDNGCSILAGPYHPSFGHMVFSEIFLDLARILLKDKLIREGTVKSVVFFVHPKNISTIRGLKSRNIDVLKSKFLLDTLHIETDDTLARDAVATGDGIVVDVRSLFSESFKQDR